MPANANNADQPAPETNTRLIMGGVIVAIGLGAVVASLWLLTSHFDVETVTGPNGEKTTNTADSSNAIVAVLTPLLAGIAAIVGLYFGITASSAARKQEAQVQVAQAETHEKALELAALVEPEKAATVIAADSPPAAAPRRKPAARKKRAARRR